MICSMEKIYEKNKDILIEGVDSIIVQNILDMVYDDLLEIDDIVDDYILIKEIAFRFFTKPYFMVKVVFKAYKSCLKDGFSKTDSFKMAIYAYITISTGQYP